MIGVRILKHLTNLQVFLRFYSVSKVPVTHVRNPREKEANMNNIFCHITLLKNNKKQRKRTAGTICGVSAF